MTDLFCETSCGFIRVHLLHHGAPAPFYGLQMMEALCRPGCVIGPDTLFHMPDELETAGLLRSEPVSVNDRLRRD